MAADPRSVDMDRGDITVRLAAADVTARDGQPSRGEVR
jgi:hypothetical protein